MVQVYTGSRYKPQTLVFDLYDVPNEYIYILGFKALKNQDSNYFSQLEFSASSHTKSFLFLNKPHSAFISL